MRTIYLAGSMENVTIEDARKWRTVASWMFQGHCHVLDPCRRLHSFKTKEFKKIFELDLRDIVESDVILVNLCEPKLAKHGTAMEVFYANYILRKPVVAFKDDPTVKHPFFEQLVTEWHSTVESAAESCILNYL